MSRRNRLSIFSISCLLAAATASAADWPQWRGPNFNGSSDETNLPSTLDPAKNLAWHAAIPGESAATPVIAGGKVFISSIDANSKLIGYALDEQTGKILWQRSIGLGTTRNERNNYASPSPITDGKHVWFYFGSGDIAAFNADDGSPIWSRNLQKDYGRFHVLWLYASSPLLYDGKLYVQVLHRSDDSYLLALDPLTGKELWRRIRPNDAIAESKESYATPIPTKIGDKSEILLIGGDTVTASDAETGNEIWRCGGYNPEKNDSWRTITSVVPVGDLVIACAPKKGPIVAIKDGGVGDVTQTHIAWKTNDIRSDVCVPLVYQGNLYVLAGDRRELLCLDPHTGHVKWDTHLAHGPVFRASPTGADGKIYCMNEQGDVTILSADKGEILSQTSLAGGPTRASIAVADGKVFVRTSGEVFAFTGK